MGMRMPSVFVGILGFLDALGRDPRKIRGERNLTSHFIALIIFADIPFESTCSIMINLNINYPQSTMKYFVVQRNFILKEI